MLEINSEWKILRDRSKFIMKKGQLSINEYSLVLNNLSLGK